MHILKTQTDKLIVGTDDVSYTAPDTSPTGTSVLNGPVYVGKPTASPGYDAALNVASNGATQQPFDTQPTYQSNLAIKVDGNVVIDGDNKTIQALLVNGDVTSVGNTKQTGNTVQTGTIKASGTITANNFVGSVGTASGKSSGAKAFDIPHPSKEGYRLRHICVEGPESAVYYRGRTNKNTIPLPLYWKDLIDPASLTVTLTPIGAHQNIIVKRWDAENIYLQNQGALPINCFFHVFAQRIDIERLIPEYEGQSTDDYPGDNSIYSINK